MSWGHQVWHVFRRDVRRTWVVLAVYTVLLAAGALYATEWSLEMPLAVGFAGLFITVSAMLAAARVVLSDVTTHADAFWAVTPLESSAVAASKLLYVSVLLVLCSTVTIGVRTAWQLMPFPLLGGAFEALPFLVLLLLGSALVASTCQSTSQVLLIVSSTLIVSLLVRFNVDTQTRFLATPLWVYLVVVLSLAGATGIVWRYRFRRNGLVARGTALSSGVAAMLFPLVGMQTTPQPRDSLTPSDPHRSLDSVSVSMPMATMPQCVGDRLMVPLAAETPRGWRLGMMQPTLDITRRDGSTLAVPAKDWMQLAGGEGPMLPTARDRRGVQVLGGDGDIPRLRTTVVFRVPAEEVSRTCGQITQLRARMWLETSTGVELIRVPLLGTNVAVAPGYRARLNSVVLSDRSVAIRMRMSSLKNDGLDPSLEPNAIDFALFNPARGELVRLRRKTFENAYSTSVLPGQQYSSAMLSLEMIENPGQRLTDVESWRRNGVLLVIAPRERGRGWATLHTTAAK